MKRHHLATGSRANVWSTGIVVPANFDAPDKVGQQLRLQFADKSISVISEEYEQGGGHLCNYWTIPFVNVPTCRAACVSSGGTCPAGRIGSVREDHT